MREWFWNFRPVRIARLKIPEAAFFLLPEPLETEPAGRGRNSPAFKEIARSQWRPDLV
jgi:hypothetical protein